MLKITGKTLIAEQLLAEELKKKGFIVEATEPGFQVAFHKEFKGKVKRDKWYVVGTESPSAPDAEEACGPFSSEKDAKKFLKDEKKKQREEDGPGGPTAMEMGEFEVIIGAEFEDSWLK